eukprot:Tbor_TRINITY_DN5479_c0_g1::TRINITY_DN5479_c0_g1_i2::g.24710::m.24710
MFEFVILGLLIAVIISIVPIHYNVINKSCKWISGIKYMIFAKDLPKFTGTNYIKMDCKPPKRDGSNRIIRVIFVRHGQSVWNSLFNKFGIMWPLRIIRSCVLETVHFLFHPYESLLIDSPLSVTGVKEATELSKWVSNCRSDQLPHDCSSSIIVCSNLRRAMATAAIGLSHRTKVTNERIVIDSALQEGSRNVDAQAFNVNVKKLVSSSVYKWETAIEQSKVFDPKHNYGNKTTDSTVYTRMDDFVKRVFGGHKDGSYVPASGGENSNLDTIICVGHSGFIRCFFRRFLPEQSAHVSKTKKLQTAGVVSFDLVRNDTTGEVFIPEDSIKPLYRNFA